jgi:hypothetical protein
MQSKGMRHGSGIRSSFRARINQLRSAGIIIIIIYFKISETSTRSFTSAVMS